MQLFGVDLVDLWPFIAIGFAAQLIDGALGMAFGIICSTLMVGVMGLPAAVASQRVHIVECFTTATSGLSHLFHRNIDKRLFFRLLIGGIAAAPFGAWAAKHLPANKMLVLVGTVLTLTSAYGAWRAFS